MKDILIIEDNEELGKLVSDFLKREELSTVLCSDAEKGLEMLENEQFRLVLLDVMLPGKNGFETCRIIRRDSSMPVLMMSARTDDGSKISGYDTGADDYIEKPFSIPVLTAKIKSLLRRTVQPEQQTLSSHGITLNLSSRKVLIGGEDAGITGKSFDVLHALMKHEGEIMNKDRLFDEIWGSDCFSEPSTLNVHIRWLREKLEEDPKNPVLIRTVWRVGYIFGDENK